jgi:predicted MPP superfamily phosphohydrolase
MSFLALRVGATAVDVALALLVFTRLSRAPARPLLARLGWAGAAAAGLFALKLPLLRAAGVTLFGFVHLAYLDLLVIPPLLLGAAYWLERRRAAPWTGRVPAVAALVGALLVTPVTGVYASFVEPFALRLEITPIPLPPARRPRSPLRIGVLADVQTAHVTAHEHRAVDGLMAQHPDVILLPGDLFHGAASTLERELAGLQQLMAKLKAPGGVYFVLGDADDQPEVARIFAGTSIRTLVNETARIVVKGQRLTIAGIELDWRAPAAAALVQTLEASGDDDVRILVAHRPDPVLTLPRPTRIDLVVAGHTHGGQVQLPFFGPPIVLSAVPRKVGGGGFHLVDGRPIYVSRGVGYEGGMAPRIRFLCPPEISLLVLGGEAGAAGSM